MSTSDFKLNRRSDAAAIDGPVVVCVMDGVGFGRQDASDAVHQARTPHLDALAAGAPGVALAAHGVAVGMPSNDDMGNSEVGHNAIGAGRVFDQGAKLVQNALHSGSVFEGQTGSVWQSLTEQVRSADSTFHFLGLLSDGNVHSHIHHLFDLIRRCDQEEIKRVRLHILTDGRDVPETSGLDYVDALEELLETLNRKSDRDYRIASGGGRMVVTMDRYEANWSVVELGWRTHVLGDARAFPSAKVAIQTFRDENPGISDQNLPAFVVAEGGEPIGRVQDHDAFVLFNFRGDRAIQISQAFEDPAFSVFDRGAVPDVAYAGMMEYDGDLKIPGRYLVAPPDIDRTLGEYLARNGHSQLAISETQKYGHVTYFWNGNKSGQFDDQLETYVEIPSDTLPFEERPWMKAAEITDRLIAELQTGKHQHARVNYANGDMVGHTGHYEASIQAVAAVDLQIGRLLPVISKLGGALIVTADHGNADEMFEWDKKAGTPKLGEDGTPRPKTSHTLNQVPCWIYAPGHSLALRDLPSPGLANLAATVLQLFGYESPDDYHSSLLR